MAKGSIMLQVNVKKYFFSRLHMYHPPSSRGALRLNTKSYRKSRVQTQSYALKATAIAHRVQSEDGICVACDAIEEHLLNIHELRQ